MDLTGKPSTKQSYQLNQRNKDFPKNNKNQSYRGLLARGGECLQETLAWLHLPVFMPAPRGDL